MTRNRITVTIGLFLLACASVATAQDTDQELRRENEALRSQVSDLQAELAALKQENERLRAEIQRLREALQAGGGTDVDVDQGEQLPVTIDESVPNASPRALRAAVKASHDEEMGDVEMGEPGSRERNLYLRRLDRWQSRALREFRRQIEWHVRVMEDQNLGRGFVTVVAVDPESGAELGDEFEVSVPRGSMRRLEQIRSRGDIGVLVLKGVAQPQITINARLPQPGAFDRDRFLAPFTLYDFAVDAQSLAPPEGDAD